VLGRRLRSLAKTRDFHLADRALHAQQQSIVHKRRVIDGLGIDEQRPDDAAKFQHGMPVPTMPMKRPLQRLCTVESVRVLMGQD
jgi:hypothetical protein